MPKAVPDFAARRAAWLVNSSKYGYTLRADQRIAGSKCPHTGLPYLRMQWEEFLALPEYSSTLPTGTYGGKRWRKDKGAGLWVVAEYGDLAPDDSLEIRWARPLFAVPRGGWTCAQLKQLQAYKREFTADELAQVELRRLQMRERLHRPQASQLHSTLVWEVVPAGLKPNQRYNAMADKFVARMTSLGIHQDVYRLVLDKPTHRPRAVFHNVDDRDMARLGLENRTPAGEVVE